MVALFVPRVVVVAPVEGDVALACLVVKGREAAPRGGLRRLVTGKFRLNSSIECVGIVVSKNLLTYLGIAEQAPSDQQPFPATETRVLQQKPRSCSTLRLLLRDEPTILRQRSKPWRKRLFCCACGSSWSRHLTRWAAWHLLHLLTSGLSCKKTEFSRGLSGSPQVTPGLSSWKISLLRSFASVGMLIATQRNVQPNNRRRWRRCLAALAGYTCPRVVRASARAWRTSRTPRCRATPLSASRRRRSVVETCHTWRPSRSDLWLAPWAP